MTETLNFGGISVNVRLELPRLEVVELEVGPDITAPPHIHADADELFIGVEGTLDLSIDGHTIALGPGDVAAAPGGQAHGFATAARSSARAVVVYAPGGFLGYFRDAAEAHTPEDFQEVLHRWGVRPA